MKKIGFTLAEMLVVSCIIGVLLWAGISTFMNYDKGVRYILSNTYYALDRALFNATTDWVPKDRYNRAIFEDIVTAPDADGNPQTYQNTESNAAEGARRLCVALTHYITPVEAGNACRNMTLANLSAEDSYFNTTPPAFTAINGVRFWITKRFTPSDVHALNEGVRFYVIYADVNGERIPNSVTYARGNGRNKQTTKDPDVFAFAAITYLDGNQTTAANVIPIGIAEVEPRYLTSRIRYFDDEETEMYSTISRPIVTSKAEAWNFYSEADSGDTIYSGKCNQMINVPLAYGDYIRKEIITRTNNGSNIYAFLGRDNFQQYYSSHSELNRDGSGNPIRFRSASSTDGGYNCIADDTYEEHCKVFIDKYFH